MDRSTVTSMHPFVAPLSQVRMALLSPCPVSCFAIHVEAFNPSQWSFGELGFLTGLAIHAPALVPSIVGRERRTKRLFVHVASPLRREVSEPQFGK
jgi:hypothetical protein